MIDSTSQPRRTSRPTSSGAWPPAGVRELCEPLVPRQRDVLVLRRFGRVTVEEVARPLGKSPGAVKALHRRGYAAIARLIDREGVTP
jgi:DNA-directed RNA polymerase specialized sigma24 family protein